MFNLKDLKEKSRKELQKLSKENNLKANGKNQEMIDRLMALVIEEKETVRSEEDLKSTKDSVEPLEVNKVEVIEVASNPADQDEKAGPETPKKLAKLETAEATDENPNTPRTSKRIADQSQETKSLDRASYAVKKHKGDTPKSASQATSKSKIPATRKYGFVRRFPVSNPSVPAEPLKSIPLPRDNPQKARSH